MTSNETLEDTPAVESGKTTSPVSVYVKDRRLIKLIRLAAVEDGTSRSDFMLGASVEKARSTLKLNRDEDFHAWLEKQAA